jgi:hypothetical protein
MVRISSKKSELDEVRSVMGKGSEIRAVWNLWEETRVGSNLRKDVWRSRAEMPRF